jgi:hypothetical protein
MSLKVNKLSLQKANELFLFCKLFKNLHEVLVAWGRFALPDGNNCPAGISR